MQNKKTTNNIITLYPSNWIYNAGVIGFLSCLDRDDYLLNNNSTKYEIKEESIDIFTNVFDNINIEDNYFKGDKQIIYLKGKNLYYPNFLDAKGKQKNIFKKFVKSFSNIEFYERIECDFCKEGLLINKELLKGDRDTIEQFFSKISQLNMVHNKFLGPSQKFKNSYWNLNTGLKICNLCTFLLIHHHLALTQLSDGSKIFINAPSFKLMYELNKLVKDIFGENKTDSKQKREILAMSIIGYTCRLQTTLGFWNEMDIDIITMRHDNFIDFYSLDYKTVNLISDIDIASLLSDIGEFYVLNSILNKTPEKLMELSQKIIKIASKKDINKSDDKFISSILRREKNKENLFETALKVLKLYILIKERKE